MFWLISKHKPPQNVATLFEEAFLNKKRKKMLIFRFSFWTIFFNKFFVRNVFFRTENFGLKSDFGRLFLNGIVHPAKQRRWVLNLPLADHAYEGKGGSSWEGRASLVLQRLGTVGCVRLRLHLLRRDLMEARAASLLVGLSGVELLRERRVGRPAIIRGGAIRFVKCSCGPEAYSACLSSNGKCIAESRKQLGEP